MSPLLALSSFKWPLELRCCFDPEVHIGTIGKSVCGIVWLRPCPFWCWPSWDLEFQYLWMPKWMAFGERWRILGEYLNNANVMQYVDLTCATLAPLRFQLSQKVGKICRDHDQAAWRQRLGLGHVHAEASREHLGCPAGHIQTLGGCKMTTKWLVFGMVMDGLLSGFYQILSLYNCFQLQYPSMLNYILQGRCAGRSTAQESCLCFGCLFFLVHVTEYLKSLSDYTCEYLGILKFYNYIHIHTHTHIHTYMHAYI